jgi:tRNA pseudouridine55 synthase
MQGFLYIDKPTGMTSFDVLRHLRRKLGIKKMGHTGTLDPLATGGLLVALGSYTKLIPFFEKDQKSYRAHILLDGVSDSYDSETPVHYISDVEKEKFQKALTQKHIYELLQQNFLGKISQIPPKYSALKIGGKRALDRVKAGEDIQMQAREIEIVDIEIISFSYPELVLDLRVSAGSYIRSIAHDL